ncbi:MAG: tetratricopeptide repeat protein [Bacteroidota bacterium]
MPKREQIQALLEANPQDTFLRFALAKEYEKEGLDEQARLAYESLVKDAPEYIGTYFHLGKALERLGEARAAFDIYSSGMEMAQQLSETHTYKELAAARFELGDEEDFE